MPIKEKLAMSLAGFPAFILYFVVAIALLALFLYLYSKLTPYREFTLIGEGNTAAAYSFGGAILGFSIPLASAISHSVSLTDMIIWALISFVIQFSVYLIVRVIFPTIARDIQADQVSKGIFLGVLSIAVGIINAACMS
jgi:putative membrane protein